MANTAYERIELHVEDGVATLTFNLPQYGNALDLKGVQETLQPRLRRAGRSAVHDATQADGLRAEGCALRGGGAGGRGCDRADRPRQGVLFGLITLVAPQTVWSAGTVSNGLPTALADARPSGFLGRLFAAIHADLRLPARLADWSDHHMLIDVAGRGGLARQLHRW